MVALSADPFFFFFFFFFISSFASFYYIYIGLVLKILLNYVIK